MRQSDQGSGRHILSRLQSRTFAVRHKTYIRVFSGLAPYFIVNEYPKSGGTWLSLMLSDVLEIPFRRNDPIRLERSVTHGHIIHPYFLKNVVVLWRDPRDIMVSYYHQCYFVHEHSNALLVSLMKAHLPFEDYSDVRGNLPEFIRFVSATPLTPRFTWPQFADRWLFMPKAVQTSYEALRADTPGELARVVKALTGEVVTPARAAEIAEKNSFKRAKAEADKQKSGGAESSFIREGSLGGWRKHFTPEAEAALAGYRPAMLKLGYK